MKFQTLGIWLLLLISLPSAVRGEVTSRDVRDAIERGSNYLKKQQNIVSGSFGEHPGHPGGLTALCVLSLLSCGDKPDEPTVAKGLAYLKGLPVADTTYSASLRIMAFAAADPTRYRQEIDGMARWLEAHQIREGDSKGSWSYSNRAGNGDNSNTQFAMLGLHEAERAGVKVADQTWQLAANYWLSKDMQRSDGAFGYERVGSETGSMTCAGVASLIIALERLNPGDATAVDGTLRCCGEQPRTEEIERGLDWLGRKFTVTTNPNILGLRGVGKTHPWLLYYLYGVERVGRMSGRRFLGSHDWFREGAEFLVEEQRKAINGSWTGTGIIENNPIVGTSLALLFLSKGRRPVVIGKLRHSIEFENLRDWDLHRRGVAHLTARIEKLWRRDLSWQTVDARHATVADLLETPVLFISGSQGLKLAAEQKQRLKEYVNQGGFLLAEACNGSGCDGAAFDKGFRALLKELFPESELRKLPPDHPVWYAQETVNPQHLPQDPDFWLWGLDTCCRTGVIYCPRSLSCYWEVAHPYRDPNLQQPLKNEVESVLRIGGNIVAYATNRELKEKLDRPQFAISQPGGKVPRGALTIPKLSHGGGSDDAPNSLANLLRLMEQKLELRVDHERRMLTPSDAKLLDYPLVFMHGRRGFTFNAAERKGLKTYLDRGGFLFADAICASEPFATSFRAEFKAIYPNSSFVRIAAGHPLLTDQMQGFDLKQVLLRDPRLRVGDDPLTAKLTPTAPFLEGLEVEGRLAVVLSPFDLSCALERGASLECKGYVTTDAAKIAANIILYALQQ